MSSERVLITGASGGIGRALALSFAENNYDLILTGRNKRKLEETRKRLSKDIGAVIIPGDLRKKAVLNYLCFSAIKNDCSILINNAAITCPGLPIEKLEFSKIREMVETNLIAPIKLSKLIYKFFEKKKYGTIVNMNSLSGLENQQNRSLYCATKWGLRGFTDSLRLEARENGIHVMGIYMSKVKTSLEDKFGMDLKKVTDTVYKYVKEREVEELILDGRPEKYRTKETINRRTINLNE